MPNILLNRINVIVKASARIPGAVKERGGLLRCLSLVVKTLKRDGYKGVKTKTMHLIMQRNDYNTWISYYGSVSSDSRREILRSVAEMKTRPLISVIMPVYNPNIEWLNAAVSSLRKQIYTNWELCIADDCSTDPDVRSILECYQKEDCRVKLVFREANGHISAASNSAVELSSGTWLALMDQDDLLPEDALFHVVNAINLNPDAGLIYSDEDKINEKNERYAPYFKSAWNPDLFLSHNMISHLGVYRSDILKSVGGFRSEYNGSQDYDLALRVIEKLKPSQIIHIPRILYHWRSHSDSTAAAGSNKNYAYGAGKRAIVDHLQRTKVKANVVEVDCGYKVQYQLPEYLPKVSIIIPTRNGLALLKQCVESIIDKTTYSNYEIIIVDNNSDDVNTLSYMQKLKEENKAIIIRDERPFNYSALNNNAVLLTNGEYIALLNNDVEIISPDWLEEMLGIATQPGVGAVGAALWYPDDTLQHGGVIVGLGGVACHAHKGLNRGGAGYFARAKLVQTMTAVTAACLLVKKTKYLEVGGLNEKDLAVAFNDVDFCLKLRVAGYRNVWTPFAELYHHESATRGREDNPEKIKRFQGEIDYMKKSWSTDTYLDPAYNPNLTLTAGDFSLSWPPRLT